MLRRTVALALCIFVFAGLGACSPVQNFLHATNEPADEYITYTVQPGDTVSQLAKHYHVTIEQLIALNANQYPSLARDPSSLKPGWQLRVPKTSEQSSQETLRTDLNQVAAQIFEGINTARAQKGLLLLRTDVALMRIASDRSQDMITRNYFSHYDPQTGQEPFLRYLQASGFSYRYAGENIAEIKNDAGWVPPWLAVAARYSAGELANQFATGWLNSPEHRANIFNTHYRRAGVALAVAQDGRRVVATQVFSD